MHYYPSISQMGALPIERCDSPASKQWRAASCSSTSRTLDGFTARLPRRSPPRRPISSWPFMMLGGWWWSPAGHPICPCASCAMTVLAAVLADEALSVNHRSVAWTNDGESRYPYYCLRVVHIVKACARQVFGLATFRRTVSVDVLAVRLPGTHSTPHPPHALLCCGAVVLGPIVMCTHLSSRSVSLFVSVMDSLS